MSRRVWALIGLLLLGAGGLVTERPKTSRVETAPSGSPAFGASATPCPPHTLPDGNVCIPVPRPAESK